MIFFGRRIFRSDLKLLVKNLQQQRPYLDSLRKNTLIHKKKKNRPNWCLDEGDIVDSKSAILKQFF